MPNKNKPTWYSRNKERHSENGRKYYNENKDQVLAKRKERREETIKYMKEYNIKYAERRREKNSKRRSELHEQAKIWRMNNPEKWKLITRRHMLKLKYGITIEKFDAIIKLQNGLCPICKLTLSEIDSKNIHVDHDHKTNRVRGVLCTNCNSGLGHAKDNVDTLQNSIEYLNYYNKAA